MNENNEAQLGGVERSIVKRRKRPHNSESFMRKLNKTKRMNGLEYVGFSTKNNKMKQNKLRKAREMGLPCSSTFCAKSKVRHCGKFDEAVRNKIFKSFWDMSPWSAKQIFVQSLVKSANVKRSRSKKSRRKQTFTFFLYLNGNTVQVFFIVTYGFLI